MSITSTQNNNSCFFELVYEYPSKLPHVRKIWEKWEPNATRKPWIQAVCRILRLTVATIFFPFWSPIYFLQQQKATRLYVPVGRKLLQPAQISRKVRCCLIGINTFFALLNLYQVWGSKNIFVKMVSSCGLKVSVESIFKIHTQVNGTLLKWIFQKDLMAKVDFAELSLMEKEALAKLGRFDEASLYYLSQSCDLRPKDSILKDVRIVKKSF